MAERILLALYQTGNDTFPQELDTSADSATLAGLTIHASGTGIVMNSKKITGLGSATASGDAIAYGQTAAELQDLTITGSVTNDGHAATKAYVDAKVLTGAAMKEAVLHDSQLDDTDGINAAVALTIATNPGSGDTIVISDGTTTRTYGAGTGGDVQYTIGGTVADTMQNLATAIEGDGSAIWGAVFTTDLDAIDADGVVVIIEDANSGTAPYIYGTWGTQANCQIVDYSAETDYTKKTTEALPTPTPSATNFGFRRTQANLTDGEVHNSLESDTLFAWDDSGDTWQYYSGLSSMPDATAASGGGTKGKITVDSDYGLAVASGILTINLETDGAIVFDSSNKGLEINLESSNPTLAITTNELGVKYNSQKALTATASGLEVTVETDGAIVFDASNYGLEVNLESSNPTLQISTNELGVKYNSQKALTATASGLEVTVETDGAIVFDASNYGLEVNLESTNPTLAISTNELGVNFDSTSGLEQDAGGLKLKIASANELSLDSSGLNVEGVPTEFNIGASAVSANVTAANVNTLVAGSTSNADSLHTHSALEVDEAERIENDINVDEAVAAGDPIYWTATGDRIGKALANDVSKSWVSGIAVTAQATPGSPTNVVTQGKAAGVLGGGGSNGARYWLQGSGGIGTTKPASGERLIMVGFGMNANDLFVLIHDFGMRA